MRALLLALCLGACATKAPPPAQETNPMQRDQRAALSGRAENARSGAVLINEGSEPIYIAGLEEWPAEVRGKKVVVTGFLTRKKLIPDPVMPPGPATAGAYGDQLVLESPQWKLAEP